MILRAAQRGFLLSLGDRGGEVELTAGTRAIALSLEREGLVECVFRGNGKADGVKLTAFGLRVALEEKARDAGEAARARTAGAGGVPRANTAVDTSGLPTLEQTLRRRCAACGELSAPGTPSGAECERTACGGRYR